ncbi:MAG: hypothetical protein HND57_08360 [Planctomycetes bacterium]|nr:hypothetical protein [Planctomycetota bacterium]
MINPPSVRFGTLRINGVQLGQQLQRIRCLLRHEQNTLTGLDSSRRHTDNRLADRIEDELHRVVQLPSAQNTGRVIKQDPLMTVHFHGRES